MDYSIILSKNYPTKQWSLNGDNYEGLIWLDESTKPTKDELDSLWGQTQSIIAYEKRITELKTLLADSDYRMTKDYFEQMSLADQDKWTTDRNAWRTELRSLENAQL